MLRCGELKLLALIELLDSTVMVRKTTIIYQMSCRIEHREKMQNDRGGQPYKGDLKYKSLWFIKII